MLRRWGCVVAAAVAGSALVVVLPQGAAEAAYGCAGGWVSRQPMNDIDGNLVASVERYQTSGGTNCYVLVSRGQYRGVEKYVSITVCDGSAASSCHSNSGSAFGDFAGPVNTDASCTSAYVIVRDPGGRTILHRRVSVGSCN